MEQRQAPTSSLLKPVESHIRVLGQYDAFSVASNLASLRLTNKANGEVSDTMSVTRVHRGVSTQELFNDIVLPCVSNAFSGQSYTFVVCGPRDSGRSFTLYGNPKLKEKGLVEHTADELLRLLSPDVGGGNRTDATVTHTHFVVEGDQIVDCCPNSDVLFNQPQQPVRVLEFQAPLGCVALPTALHLDSAPSAVVIQPTRSLSSSMLTQFQVYGVPSNAPSGQPNSKRSLGVITFVDVCAFARDDSSTPSDLMSLCRAVTAAADGADTSVLRSCRLTQLLETSIIGSTTMCCIATVTGNPDLFHETKRTLQFASCMSKIQQVMMLVHLQTPKWIFDAAAQCEQLKEARTTLFANSYATGVFEFFTCAQQLITKNCVTSEDTFDVMIAEANAARQRIADEIRRQSETLKLQIDALKSSAESGFRDVAAVGDANDRVAQQVDMLDARAHELRQVIAQLEQDGKERILTLQSEVQRVRDRDCDLRAEVDQFFHLQEDCAHECDDAEFAEAKKVLQPFSSKQSLYAAAKNVLERLQKKRRLEEKLTTASMVVDTVTSAKRQTRARHDLQDQVSVLQQRVGALRSRSASLSQPDVAEHREIAASRSYISSSTADRSGFSDDFSTANYAPPYPTTARHHVDPSGAQPTSSGSRLPSAFRQRQQATSKPPTPTRISPKPQTLPSRGGSENTSIATLYLR